MSELDNVTFNFNAEFFEKLRGKSAAGNPRRRLARRSAFQNVT